MILSKSIIKTVNYYFLNNKFGDLGQKKKSHKKYVFIKQYSLLFDGTYKGSGLLSLLL